MATPKNKAALPHASGVYRCTGYGCHFTDAELLNAGYGDRRCELGDRCPCMKSCEHGEQCPSYLVQKRSKDSGQKQGATIGAHLIEGSFQSDKYPTTPRGKVPLSVKDVTAQDLLYEYAQRRRLVDSEFSDDLETALSNAGYKPGSLGGVVVIETATNELHIIPRVEVRHVAVLRPVNNAWHLTYTIANASPRTIEFFGDHRPEALIQSTPTVSADEYNGITAQAMLRFLTRGAHDMRIVQKSDPKRWEMQAADR